LRYKKCIPYPGCSAKQPFLRVLFTLNALSRVVVDSMRREVQLGFGQYQPSTPFDTCLNLPL
jgi:hypothetical protein